MFQKLFNLFNIDSSWLGRLIAMSIVASCYAFPYLIMLTVGLKPAYSLGEFIFIISKVSLTTLCLTFIFTVFISHHLVKPQSLSEWKILKRNNSKSHDIFGLNNFIAGASEEIIFRFIMFYNVTTLLSAFKMPEIAMVLIFVAVSAYLFAITHRRSRTNKTFYYYYLFAGVFLALVFLLTGLVGSTIIHLAFNATTDLAKNYYLDSPTDPNLR